MIRSEDSVLDLEYFAIHSVGFGLALPACSERLDQAIGTDDLKELLTEIAESGAEIADYQEERKTAAP